MRVCDVGNLLASFMNDNKIEEAALAVEQRNEIRNVVTYLSRCSMQSAIYRFTLCFIEQDFSLR